jgi:hypothetical protein
VENCWLKRRFPGASRQRYTALKSKVSPLGTIWQINCLFDDDWRRLS